MALLHHATLSPSKPELLAAWLPSQPWAAGLTGLKPFGSYRLDDPDGEVGIEGILLRTEAGDVLHVPLTYRAAPLEGAGDALLGTMEHSALGTRWVYDATADPVWHATLIETVLTGGTGAEEYFEVDGQRETREPSVAVAGSGLTSGADHSDLDVVVIRRVGEEIAADAVLTGAWEGGAGVLAGVRTGG
jgi:maltokinase-like protein